MIKKWGEGNDKGGEKEEQDKKGEEEEDDKEGRIRISYTNID